MRVVGYPFWDLTVLGYSIEGKHAEKVTIAAAATANRPGERARGRGRRATEDDARHARSMVTFVLLHTLSRGYPS